MLVQNGRLEWVRGSYCESGACVEAAVSEEVVRLQNSNAASSAHLTFSWESWRRFVRAVAVGEIAQR